MYRFEETGTQISKIDRKPIKVGILSVTCGVCQHSVLIPVPPDKGQRACSGCGTLFVYDLKRDKNGLPVPVIMD